MIVRRIKGHEKVYVYINSSYVRQRHGSMR